MKIPILGLDPGLASTGYAILLGDTDTGSISLSQEYGIIHTKKWIDKGLGLELPMRQRLDQISNDITKLVAEVEPKYVAMEDFVYYGNRGQTTSSMPVLIENIRMLGKGMGYDVAIYTNAYWKSILLKNHTADKHQVEHRVHMLLNLDAAIWNKSDPKTHMRDAMAIALTFWQLHTHKAAPPKRKGVPMKELKMKWSS